MTSPYATQAQNLLGQWSSTADMPQVQQYLSQIDTPAELAYMQAKFDPTKVPHFEELTYQLAGFGNQQNVDTWLKQQGGQTLTPLESMLIDNPGMAGQSVVRPDIPNMYQGVADPSVADGGPAYTQALYNNYGVTPADYNQYATNWVANNSAAAQAARDTDSGLFGDILPLILTGAGLYFGLPSLFGEAGASALTAADMAAGLLPASELAAMGVGAGTAAGLGGLADAGYLNTLGEWGSTAAPATTAAATPVATAAATPAATTGTIGAIGGTTAAADAAAGLLTPAQLGAMGVSPLAQAQMGFTGLGNLASGTGSYLSNLLGGTGVGTTTASGSIWPSVISGGLNLAGGLLSANAAGDAADKQAETQLAIADMMRFRPVGVTTRFGSSNFGYDPATGNLTSAGYTLSPETKALQDSLMGAAPGLLSQFTGSQAATAPMGTAAQAAMNLGNQYLTTSPQAQAQKYMDEQMALLQPQNERALAALEAKLQAQGRLGLATGGTSTLGASNPELEALYNAQKMQQLQLAAAATQGGMDYAKFGTAMAGAGGDLLNSMYGTQVAAFNPYNTALTGANTLEGMGQQAMNLGTTLGAQQTTANTPAANLMGQAAATQAAGNAVSPWGALLSGAGNAIQNYQTQQQQQQYQNSLLAALTNGNSQWGK